MTVKSFLPSSLVSSAFLQDSLNYIIKKDRVHVEAFLRVHRSLLISDSGEIGKPTCMFCGMLGLGTQRKRLAAPDPGLMEVCEPGVDPAMLKQ